MPDIPLAAVCVLLVCYLPPATVLAVIDAQQHRLPNRWVGVLSGAVLLGVLLVAVQDPALWSVVRTGLLLAAVAGIAALLVALAAPGLIGMGDAKTLPAVVLMAAVLGGEVLVGSLLAIAVLGGLLGTVVLLVTRRAGARFAFGPVLLSGPFLGILAAPLVAQALGTG